MKDTLNPDPGNKEGEGGDKTPNQSQAMTRAQLQELLTENQTPLAEAVAQLGQRVAALQQTTQKQAPAGKGNSPAEDEFVSELLSNGKDVVRREAAEVVREALSKQFAPYFAAKLPAERNAQIATNRDRVDADYGKGFFDEHVMPLLLSKDGKSGALATMSLADQSLPEVVEATVDGVIGRIVANPETRRIMLDGLKKQEEARVQERRVLNPPRALAPGLPAGIKPADVEIPDHVAESLGDMKKLGITFTQEDLLGALSRGNTAEEWDAVYRKPPAANK